ncbi:MAG: hypothetical protein LEGION0398_MBIBDBAK_00900 [Legionellaceae bacterium]
MDTYLSDQELVEQIKKWLQKNALLLLFALGMGVLIGFIWHRLQVNKESALASASIRYEKLLSDLQQNNPNEVNQAADYLIKRYPQTAYASLAKLIQAKIAINQQDLTLANTKFDWVIEHAKSAPIQQIARIRKARILIAMNKPEEALELLKRINEPAFIALIESVKGDAYTIVKQYDNARASYQLALQNLPETQSIRPLIQMKMDNLPLTYTGNK